MSQVYLDVDPAYATTCSDVTLYSNQRGFFSGLAEEAVAMVSEEWLKRLTRAEGDGGKIAAVMENKELKESLTEVLSRVQPICRGKDARLSQQRRLEAQKALEQGELVRSLGLASQAVLKAPVTDEIELIDGGVSLALALWTRSEALLKGGRPAAALQDLKVALKERLPAKMRAQYYWRMGHCYKGAGEPTRAKVSYELAARLMGSDQEARARLAEDVETLGSITPKPQTEVKRAGVTVTAGAKQNMPALSKLVKITEEQNEGRFAVASSPVKTGDVLLVENPYASCLLPDCYGTHCLHCFKRLEDNEEQAPVGCPKCSGVAFCSFQCRDVAVATYHVYECPFLDIYIGSGMSILSHVALRMVTQAGLEASLAIHSKHLTSNVKTVEGSALNDIEGASKKSRMKTRKERLNRSKKSLRTFDKNNKDETEETVEEKMNFEENLELKSAQIYSLCAHSEQRKPDDYLKRIVMALFLSECLKKSGFFNKCDEEQRSQNERAISELLLRNLQLLQFNAHELYETLRGSHQFSGSKANYIAVAIYPTGALFNHECYPAVARYFEGRKIVLRATRPLVPGEVVSENYGPHFMVRSLKDRQRALASRYWFRCACVACKEDWPLLKQMNSDASVVLRCPNSDCFGKFRVSSQLPSRCGKCSTTIEKEIMAMNLETVKRSCIQYQEGAKCMDSEKSEEAIAAMCPAVDSYHEVATPPHKETHLAQESLRSCFAAAGNVHVVTMQGEERHK